jgi:group I intron endonuclease
MKNIKSGVYCITNNLNGMKYVGQSSNLHKRFISHFNKPFWKKDSSYNGRLYSDIRKLGLDKFTFSILEETVSEREVLYQREIYWIKKLKTLYPNGYNKTKGGRNSSPHISELDLCGIVMMLMSGCPAKPIMNKFHISVQTVTDINVGRYRRIDGMEYPIRSKSHKS